MITFPLSVPAALAASGFELVRATTVGATRSPFTSAQQTYDWGAGRWGGRITVRRMKRADAADVIAFLASLNGLEGSFLLGPDPVNTSPRGTWAGSPKVKGAQSAGLRSIPMDGFTASATVKAMDWFQQGTGSSSRLHMVLQDATADGAGELTLEVWPPTRAALSDDETFVTSAPKGLFMLASNEQPWRQGLGGFFVVVDFAFEEDLRGL